MAAPAIQFELRGVTQMRAALKAAGADLRRRLALGLRVEAERIKTNSQRNFVPADHSHLKASGHVTPVEDRGDELVCQIVFGGPSAPYAVSIHEFPSAASPPSWRGKVIGDIHAVRSPHAAWSLNGRGPKYLERPMKLAEPGFADRIAKLARI